MEALGPKLRRQRRRLGLTLDDLAVRASISKPYLSLIETGRVANPPSDEKLRRLEQTLGFTAGELITQAHLQRTPKDVRAMLATLMGRESAGAREGSGFRVQGSGQEVGVRGQAGVGVRSQESGVRKNGSANALHTTVRSSSLNPEPRTLNPRSDEPLNLDAAYLSGMLAELVDRNRGNIEPISTGAVPIINKVAAGYPRDFTDLAYPRGIADEYLSCPDVRDTDAFAARVHGDSMFPKYSEGDIVVFSPAAPMKDGDDCFVRFEDGQTTFKRVFFETDDTGRAVIRLQPRNERYRPQVTPREQINGLYKAVYRYQRLDD